MPTFVLSVPELSTYWGRYRPISVLVSFFHIFYLLNCPKIFDKILY